MGRYLKQGELVVGEPEKMDGNKVKLAKISSPMVGGILMCEVEKIKTYNRQEDNNNED